MKNLFVISLNGDLLRWGSDFVCYTTGVSVERKSGNGIECDSEINGVSGSLQRLRSKRNIESFSVC